MLSPGVRVGALEVLGPLGAGGMGEVWRARDTRLGREVALKVLPDGLAADPDRLSRLEREARLLAALNHPGIAAIYGLEQSDGVPLLVLELVEGPTLAERLRRGPLPVREALEIGRQIAEALEAAHEKGIIHRDLKPSNVKLAPQGRVKLLDFGLAKALAADVPADVPANETSGLSTDTSPTEAGVLMGTAPYMSPEQARREAVDRRTDVWGFGCVVYEMLAGRRAFPGRTLSDVIAAVLEREPDWTALPPATPGGIRSLLRRCLQRDNVRRLHDIADVRIEIAEALAGPTDGDSSSRPVGRWPRLLHLGTPLVAAVVAAGAVWSMMRGSPSTRPQPRRFTIQLPSGALLATNLDGPSLLSLSPDGAHLVYVSLIEGRGRRLSIRPLDQLHTRTIPGTEDAVEPFFSPDGRWIGFAAQGKVKKVAVAGGPASVICDAPGIRGASWGLDGNIIFTPLGRWAGLSRVSAEGGRVEVLTTPDPEKGEASHRWPQLLPGGRAVLFTIHALSARQDEGRIAFLSLDTGERRVLVTGGTYGRYVATGHLVYASGGTLLAAPFALDRMQVTGPAVPVLDDVSMEYGGTGVAHFTVSAEGQLAYVAGFFRELESSLVWVDRRGNAQPATAERRAYGGSGFGLLPDGHSVVVTIEGPTTEDIWRLDFFRDSRTRLTFEKDSDSLVLSPDGGRVAFSSNRMGRPNLFWMPTTGGVAERLTTATDWQRPTGWSPDGSELLFNEQSPDTSIDIWVLPLAGDRRPRPLVATRFAEGGAVFSPNGQWLAYASDESGRSEVYVRPYAGAGRKWQVSTDGGLHPRWARNGRELFYMSRGRLMAVPVESQAEFRSERPRVLFSGRYLESALFTPPPYDVTPKGDRFLMLLEGPNSPEVQIVYVPDWFDELKARVPGGTGRWR